MLESFFLFWEFCPAIGDASNVVVTTVDRLDDPHLANNYTADNSFRMLFKFVFPRSVPRTVELGATRPSLRFRYQRSGMWELLYEVLVPHPVDPPCKRMGFRVHGNYIHKMPLHPSLLPLIPELVQHSFLPHIAPTIAPAIKLSSL